MNKDKIILHCCNIAAAVCLAGGSGAVLAKGPGTNPLENRATRDFDCVSTDQSTRPAAKSPQQTLSYTCSPAASSTAPAQLGETAAKIPSRGPNGLR
jgi:hypothetical protein